MTQGLPVSRIVNVDVTFSPLAAQAPNLNSGLIVGSSDVINVTTRIMSFANIEEVSALFGTNTPEYEAALLWFSQVPQPDQLYIGRWAENATAGLLICGILSATEQTIATWQAITAGEFKLAVDGGAATNITCGSFAAAANLNAVATIIQTAVQAEAGAYADVTVTWNGSQFVFTSGTTGVGSAVAALTAGTANDISAMLKGTAATLSLIVDGIAAETPVQAVTILDDLRQFWYFLTFASTTITDAQQIAVADYIEAAGNKHIFGISTINPDAYDPNVADDIASLVKAQGYNRTIVQYSETNYTIASFFGRAVTVNFNGNNTVLTMMFKTEPSVVPESLTSSQAEVLKSKNCTVYVNYNNNTAILEYANMGSGAWFDEIQDTDWLAYSIQTAVYNLLYTSTTKIPQTDAGNHLIGNAVEGACAAAVTNGTLAPGVWNANGFGQIKQGDWLDKGYYVYVPPIYTQNQADREARKAVPIQVAAKLAGAVQSADVIVNVNR